MFKFLLSSLLLFNTAADADQGTTQKHLLHVTPSASSTDVDPNTSVQIVFDGEIDARTFSADLFKLKHDGLIIKGATHLGSDKKSITFTPDTALETGEHLVGVASLRLQGSEQKPCRDLWNSLNVQLCESFSWRCDDLCYKEVSKRTEPVSYSFSVAENAIKVTSLNITTKTTDLNESETVPVTVTAFFDDNTTEDVTDKASWESSDSSVATVETGKLFARQEGTALLSAIYNNTISTEVTINVYKVVDNHRLPPEPDEALNNVTLLGIDVNNNGVRDDVERWIYLEMEILNGYPEIERAIGMQKAKANQMALSDPFNKDDKVQEAITAAHDCWIWYDYLKKSHVYGAHGKFSRLIKDKVFNTQERLKTYMQYDATLVGRVFTSTPGLQLESQCETKIDEL
ncbi:Ig-like domain-containing protein [Sulfurimonas sp. HSL3-7]|uniref:Ig-like domain-containing protein n=1 Tax=Sulfonitrofixus jiaomeiensis TaxID=3131938 RepID=UPI0031F9F562